MARSPISLLDAEEPHIPMRQHALPAREAGANDFGGQIGQGLGEMGGALQRLGQIYENDQKTLKNFQLQKGSVDWASDEQQRLMEAQRGISGAGADFTKTYMAGFDDRSKQFLDGISDPEMKAKWSAKMAEYRSHFATRALVSEFEARKTYYGNEIEDLMNKNASGISQDPSKLDAYRQQGDAAIMASGLSQPEKEAFIRKWKNGSAVAAASGSVMRDPEGAFHALGGIRQSKWINPDEASQYRQLEEQHGLPQGYLGGVARVESEGDGDKNSRSSTGNLGRFQFYQKDIDYWFKLGGVQRRGSVGSTEDQALATAIEGAINAKKIEAITGRPATAGELYMAHQQGTGGIEKLMRNPNANAAATLGASAVTGNGGTADMTNQQFLDMWSRKFGGAGSSATAPKWVGDLTFEQQQHYQAQALQRIHQIEITNKAEATEAGHAYLSRLELGIHDGKINQVDINNERTAGRLTRYDDIAKLEGLLKARDKDQKDLSDGLTALQTDGFQWSTQTPEHRDLVNAVSKAKGYNAVVDAGLWEHTGIMPDRFSERLRSDLLSGDAQKVTQALSIADRMLRNRPGAFAGVTGQKELEEAALFYDRQREVMRQSDIGKIGQAWIDSKDPMKATPVAEPAKVEAFKKSLGAGSPSGVHDLIASSWDDKSSWFGQSWRTNRTKEAYGQLSIEQRAPIERTFKEVAAEEYARTGNEALAVAAAQKRIADTYGLSNFTSGRALGGQVPLAEGRVHDTKDKPWEITQRSSTFWTPYPAEKAYGEAVVGGGTEWIYKAAAEEASKAAGHPVDPSDVQLRPLAGRAGEAQTREAFNNRGRPGAPPVPYQIWYVDRNMQDTNHVIATPWTADKAKRDEQARLAAGTAAEGRTLLERYVTDPAAAQGRREPSPLDTFNAPM